MASSSPASRVGYKAVPTAVDAGPDSKGDLELNDEAAKKAPVDPSESHGGAVLDKKVKILIVVVSYFVVSM